MMGKKKQMQVTILGYEEGAGTEEVGWQHTSEGMIIIRKSTSRLVLIIIMGCSGSYFISQ
jgi:hypothetical protein